MDGRKLIDEIPSDFLRKDSFSGNELLLFGFDGYSTSPKRRQVLEIAARVLADTATQFRRDYPKPLLISSNQVNGLCKELGVDSKLVRWVLRETPWHSPWQDKDGEHWQATPSLGVLMYSGVADGPAFLKIHHSRYIPEHVPGFVHRQFLRAVVKYWQANCQWPEHDQFCIDYDPSVFVPRLVSDLHDKYLRKDTTGSPGVVRIILNLKGLAATGLVRDELDGFVRVLSHLVSRFRENEGEYQVSANDLSRDLKLPKELTTRIVQLFDRELVGAYLVDRAEHRLKVQEYVLEFTGIDSYFKLARKLRRLPLSFDPSELKKHILATFRAANDSGYPYLTQVDLRSKDNWCGDLECYLGCPLTAEEDLHVEDALYGLVEGGELHLLGDPNDKGEVLFALGEPKKQARTPIKDYEYFQRKLNPPVSERVEDSPKFTCLRCGRLSQTPFPITIGNRALCPPCTSAEQSASAIIGFGLLAPLEVGARFGKFTLQEFIGSGTYGSVWKALDTVLGRIVALKFSNFQEGEDYERFKREANAAAGLEHPHIARVYGVHEERGRTFIEMHFIEGSTLEIAAKRSPHVIADIMKHIVDAIGFAHVKGIIHRDIKPGNVLLDGNLRPFVTDFGLARDLRASKRLSLKGVVVGTLPYVSPEQLEGGDADNRSDIYSLGVVFYELVTGKHPPDDEAEKELANDERELVKIAKKCLAKKPENRFQSAMELLGALDAVIETLGEVQPESPANAGPTLASTQESMGPDSGSDWEAEALRKMVLSYFQEEQNWCPIDGALLDVVVRKPITKKTWDLFLKCPNCGRTATHIGSTGESKSFSKEQVSVIRNHYFADREAACPFDGSLLNVIKRTSISKTRASILVICPYCGAEGSDPA